MPIKKISAAWHRSVASTGSGEEDQERQEGEATEAEGGEGNFVIKAHFGEPLLFICYEFLHEMHRNPKNYDEVFEFTRYSKVKNMLKEMAFAAATAKSGAGGQAAAH